MLRLLLNARVFAPEPLGLRHVLVAGEQIAGLFDAPPDLAGVDVETTDLEGRALVPGLVDAHVHITGGGGEAGYASSVPPIPLSHYTAHGVTSVVGLLGTDDVTRSTENLVARAYALRQEGLSAWCWTGGYAVPPRTLTGDVRRDIVFVDPIVGCAEIAISDHRSSQPTFDELARLAGLCHTAGMISGKAGVLHFHLGDGARGLDFVRRLRRNTEVPARTLMPTHVNRNPDLFDEALRLVREDGVGVDVTAFPDDEHLAPALSAPDAVERFWNAGLPDALLTLTSDAGGSLPTFDATGNLVKMGVAAPDALLATLQTLLRRGHPLENILPTMTATPAARLRLHAKGRIAAGCDADLVVLDDGGALVSTMARGRWHVLDGQQIVRGTFEH